MRRDFQRNLAISNGFTLVEMIVALLFTGLLMAGMARVYQGSLGIFKTTAEKVSANRKGRIALDILSDDLDRAGMYLDDFEKYPALSTNNPGFYIIPNVPLALGDGQTHVSDELYFFVDDALPFQGTMNNSLSSIGTSSDAVASGVTLTSGNANTATVTLQDPSFVSWITPDLHVQFAAQAYKALPISNIVPAGAGSPVVSFSLGTTDQNTLGTTDWHVLPGSLVFFVRPKQMIRYYVAGQALDPANPGVLTPCLMRDQGVYNSGGFVGTAPQVMAEDVQQIKAYLSANGGQNWAGKTLASTTTGFSAGWLNGIVPDLNNQLATYGQTDVPNVALNANWYREIPCLVRIDITTRTAMKRTEYSATVGTADYGTQMRSLVIVPRHFGLSFAK